jgi:Xaa-Pro aminopeptidase
VSTSTTEQITSTRRRAVLRKARSEATVDAFLATKPVDVSYLSDFGGEDSFLLVEDDRAVLLTDSRFGEQAEKECPGVDIHVRSGPITEALAEVLKGRRVRRLGLQSEHVTLKLHEALQDALGSRKLVGLFGVPSAGRIIKDDGELASIRKAVRVAQKAFRELTRRGAEAFVGRREQAIAAELDAAMRRCGATASSFETIVASGPGASVPHYRPGRRKIRAGEAVLIDWGALVEGYCSDLTRVVFVGTIPPALKEVYDVVRAAQRAGIEAIRSGVHSKTVDAAARKVIEQAGYGEQFIHGLGHGIGREIHEAPGLSGRSDTPLRAGMVVTVEPGIYLPGVGGIRIEDDVLVTVDGQQKLSSLPTSANSMILH